jgi:hypothetical protein
VKRARNVMETWDSRLLNLSHTKLPILRTGFSDRKQKRRAEYICRNPSPVKRRADILLHSLSPTPLDSEARQSSPDMAEQT